MMGRSCPGCCGASRTATSPAKSPTRIRLPAGAGRATSIKSGHGAHRDDRGATGDSAHLARGRKAQVAALGQRRAARDEAAVTQSLRALRENSTTDTNMIPVLLEATRREATLGEICNVLREQWGEYSSRRTSGAAGQTGLLFGWVSRTVGVGGLPDGRPRLPVLCQLVVVSLRSGFGVVVVPGVGGVLGAQGLVQVSDPSGWVWQSSRSGF